MQVGKDPQVGDIRPVALQILLEVVQREVLGVAAVAFRWALEALDLACFIQVPTLSNA